MTQEEFDKLEVGDILKHSDGTEIVVFSVNRDDGIVTTVVSKVEGGFECFGEWYSEDSETLQDWAVLSKVRIRESVKGGE